LGPWTAFPGPGPEYFDFDLYEHSVRLAGVQVRVEDLVHPRDHPLRERVGYLLSLFLWALDHQFVMAGADGHHHRGRARWGR